MKVGFDFSLFREVLREIKSFLRSGLLSYGRAYGRFRASKLFLRHVDLAKLIKSRGSHPWKVGSICHFGGLRKIGRGGGEIWFPLRQ